MKVSIIIPALNEAAHILPSVLSACRQPGEIEVIVVDGGSTDVTVATVRPYARVLSSPPGRAVQMNAGARQASGEVLLFLHADTCLPPAGLTDLRQVLADPAVAGGTFTLSFDREAWLLRLYAFITRFRCRYLHYGDQGIFVKRAIFERLGGFREIPLMEDIDFLERLARQGRLALIPRPVVTSARRFQERGLVRQQLLNMSLVLLYLLGVSPETLARWYR